MFNICINIQISSSSLSLSLLCHSPSHPVTRRGHTPNQPFYCIHIDHMAPSESWASTSFLAKACLTCDAPLTFCPHTSSCPALGPRDPVPIFSLVLSVGPALDKLSRMEVNVTSMEMSCLPTPPSRDCFSPPLFFFVTLGSCH